MIAIGGCIGTGLFMTSGGAIHDAGALGALIAYAIGTMVFFLMTSLGEMATYLPVSGSFSTYATRFVDPSLGFALGWNYWFNWVTVALMLPLHRLYSIGHLCKVYQRGFGVVSFSNYICPKFFISENLW